MSSTKMARGPAMALLLAIPLTTNALAQGQGPGSGPGSGGGWGMGPGAMMGPGMMGRGGLGFMCNPRTAGMAEWRIQRIETAVKPNEAQRAALNDLKAASTKAAETIAATCKTEVPATSKERLALMEKRMESLLQAVKTVRPAFDAFYDKLDADQKAKVDAAGPRRWGWDNWHWPWRNR